jgi:hypothetical protein
VNAESWSSSPPSSSPDPVDRHGFAERASLSRIIKAGATIGDGAVLKTPSQAGEPSRPDPTNYQASWVHRLDSLRAQARPAVPASLGSDRPAEALLTLTTRDFIAQGPQPSPAKTAGCEQGRRSPCTRLVPVSADTFTS